MKKEPVVYQITASDGQTYVGSTSDLEKRIRRHNRDLMHGVHHNTGLQERFNAGMELSVDFENVESRQVAFDDELLLIRTMDKDKVLNIGRHARGGDNLTLHPAREDILERRTETVRALMDAMTPEERAARYGRPGELNGMFGKTHTPETVELIKTLANQPERLEASRLVHLGVKRSEETRRKLSTIASERTGDKNSFYGKTHSDETRQRISAAKLGVKPTNVRPVEIEGVIYPSVTEAGRQLGVVPATILHRLKSANPKYTTYRFAVEGPTTTESDERNKTIDE